MKLTGNSCLFPLRLTIFSVNKTSHFSVSMSKFARQSVAVESFTERELGQRESHGKVWARALKQNGDLNGAVCVFIRFSDEDSLQDVQIAC